MKVNSVVLVRSSCKMKTIESTFSSTILLTTAIVLLSEADVYVMAISVLGPILRYISNIPKGIVNIVVNPPSNSFGSIQYFLYTPSNPKVQCYIEPNPENFNGCAFNSSYPTKFLMPGINTSLSHGNVFEEIKDKLLSFDQYNVIIVNYTAYTYPPFTLGVASKLLVGPKVAEMVHFLVDYAGVNPEDVHLIGHSLGSHLAGVIGRKVPNLGRITGLDPGGPLFTSNPFGLRPSDANFVDVIHTSNYLQIGSGFGLFDAIGDIDFYPNGGEMQPGCEFGDTFVERDRSLQRVITLFDKLICNHLKTLDFFLNSIESCEYLATSCSSYEKYKAGKCPPQSPTNRMGLHAMKIEGLEPRSKFFLKTDSSAPYCETK